jgi:hypothetical protein
VKELIEGSGQRLGDPPLAVVEPVGLFDPGMLISEGE